MGESSVRRWIRNRPTSEQTITLALAIQMSAGLVLEAFENVLPPGADDQNLRLLRNAYEEIVGQAHRQPAAVPSFQLRHLSGILMGAESMPEEFFGPLLPDRASIRLDIEEWRDSIPPAYFSRKTFLEAGQRFASALEQLRTAVQAPAKMRKTAMAETAITGVTAAQVAWQKLNANCKNDQVGCINRYYDRLKSVAETAIADHAVILAIKAAAELGTAPEVRLAITVEPVTGRTWAYAYTLAIEVDGKWHHKRVAGVVEATGDTTAATHAAAKAMLALTAPARLLIGLPAIAPSHHVQAKEKIEGVARSLPNVREVDYLRGFSRAQLQQERARLETEMDRVARLHSADKLALDQPL